MPRTSLPAPPPDALARLLPPEVDLEDEASLRHPAARPVWLGVVWSRLGRSDLAWEFWDRVGADDVRPWVAAERGRVLREFGLHARAERLEWRALAEATDAVDQGMLRISLTADAVGRGDLDTAERRLAASREAVAELPDGPRAARQRLRLAWVAVEVAYLAGRPPATEELADLAPDGSPVLPADHDHGTTFHRAKGLLFGGLVRRSLPLLDLAAAAAPPVLAWAVHLARQDLGVAEAADSARRAWADVVPPAPVAGEVAATPTARRLAH